MAAKAKNINMTEGPLLKGLLAFAVPQMLMGLANVMYGAADTAVLGIFSGRESMAGVGSTGALYSMLLALFLGFTGGIVIVAGRAIGKRDRTEIREVVHTAVASSFMFGVLVGAIGIIFAEPLLRITSVPENVMAEAKLYMQIVFISAPMLMLYNCISAILLANGNSKRPLIVSLISGAVNVLFNVVFVVFFDLGAAGVAIGTVISQTFMAVMSTVFIVRGDDETKLHLKEFKISPRRFADLCKVGFPMGFQTLIFSFANVIVQSSINTFGDAAIAGNSAAGSVTGFLYIELNAASAASTAFISQNYGAKKFDRIKKVIFYSCGIVLAIWGAEVLISVFLGKPLLSVYTPGDNEAINLGYVKMLWVGAFYGLNGLAEITLGATRAIGYSITPTVISIIGVCGVRAFWIYTAFAAIGTFGSIFVCYPLSWFITFVASGVLLLAGFSKIQKLHEGFKSI